MPEVKLCFSVESLLPIHSSLARLSPSGSVVSREVVVYLLPWLGSQCVEGLAEPHPECWNHRVAVSMVM